MPDETMRIEITEKRLSTSDPETGQHYLQSEGDVIRVPASFGALLCSRGWAKDVDGQVETGERVVVGATLRPDNVKHKTRTKNGG